MTTAPPPLGGKIFWIHTWLVLRTDSVLTLPLPAWCAESKEFEFGQACDYEDCVLDNMFIKCDLYSFFRKSFKYINIYEHTACRSFSHDNDAFFKLFKIF